MTASRIIQIATQNPPRRMTQQELLQEALKYHTVSDKARELYTRFFNDHGIHARFLGLDTIEQVFTEDYDQALSRFQKVATEIASGAVETCLEKSGVALDQINGLIVTTCTGYLCPGLSTYVAQAVGLNEDIFLLDLVGQGCGAALPALRAADHFLATRPKGYVLSVSVEVCSAAFFNGEETDLLISNAIFGDGAAAVLVSNVPGPGLEIGRFESMLSAKYRDELRFKSRCSRLCNVISKKVPVIAAAAVKRLKARYAQDGAYRFIGFHTGGRAVLDRIASSLGMSEEDMQYSRRILQDYGNMSSPSIMFVLKDMLDRNIWRDGDRALLFSFGAGFSAHAVSVAWKD